MPVQEPIGFKAVSELIQFFPTYDAPSEGGIPRVIAELDSVDGVDFITKKLQRKGRAFIPCSTGRSYLLLRQDEGEKTDTAGAVSPQNYAAHHLDCYVAYSVSGDRNMTRHTDVSMHNVALHGKHAFHCVHDAREQLQSWLRA